ncbi:MAG: AAA family ATPase [Thermoanaerobaculia bacterium]|nr:MAG: AAA family ATPase [Thermoanaerobaculia bacterium]MBZ0101893.1 AAA family ATPase [Thermoanaerobaculia bacterium]
MTTTAETRPEEDQGSDGLAQLLAVLPREIEARVRAHGHFDRLIEIVLDLGRVPEARYTDASLELGAAILTREDLAHAVDRIGVFGPDNRAGIERTLHRISALRNRRGAVIGLTCRVGRAVVGTVDIVRDVIESGHSTLLLGRPGVGKTTLLREAARVLADDLGKRVVVVDTSNEIAGDGDIPHPGIGRARRMQVHSPAEQHATMIEAVENHMPEVIVIDEIGTQAEALAARTIAERGVQLIATAHGNALENLLANPTLSDLVGGIQAVTLSDDEARRRGTQKTVLERKAPPTFDALIEIQDKQRFAVHRDVAEVVDRALRGLPPRPEVRVRSVDGSVAVESSDAAGSELPIAWPGSGERPSGRRIRKRIRILPYAVSSPRLERSIRDLRVPAVVVDRLGDADCVLTLKSQEKRLPKALRAAQAEGRPIHVLRNGTTGQIETFLRSMFDVEDVLDEQQMALREAEAAVREALGGGRPIELAPQSSFVRRLQHELVDRCGLASTSRGDEPFRRVVVFPEPVVSA